MKYVVYLVVLLISVADSALAEMRIWSDKKGNTIEAEFVSIMGSKVVLKTPEGKMNFRFYKYLYTS